MDKKGVIVLDLIVKTTNLIPKRSEFYKVKDYVRVKWKKSKPNERRELKSRVMSPEMRK